MLVGVRNKELTAKLGIMNMAKFNRANLAGDHVSKEQPSVIDDKKIKNGFYGAPAVAAVFCQNNFLFRTADAFCCAKNMILQATELGTAAVSNLFYRPPCGIVLKAEIVGPVTGLCIFKHDPVFVVGLAADHRKAVIISHIQVFLVNFRHFVHGHDPFAGDNGNVEGMF